MNFLSLLFIAFLAFPSFAFARGHGGHNGGHSGYGNRGNGHKKCTSCSHDNHGRITRSAKPKHGFRETHPCPSTGKTSGDCPGYVIDHIKPLKRGGADAPSNLQWQTKEDAKAKDRWE